MFIESVHMYDKLLKYFKYIYDHVWSDEIICYSYLGPLVRMLVNIVIFFSLKYKGTLLITCIY